MIAALNYCRLHATERGKTNLFITGDTGPMHLASVLGVNILAIFGPSDPIINKPWGKNNIVVYKDVGCNPCRKRKCKLLKCQYELKPIDVFKKIGRLKN